MIRLNTLKAGKGPTLVMLHGLFGSIDNFRSVALHMERHMSVVRIDLPGHGESPTLPRLSIEDMAQVVLHELSAQGIEQFHLLGHSLGGKVAMSMAGSPQCQGMQRLCVVDIAPKPYPPHHQPIIDALSDIDLTALGERREADVLLRSAIPDAGVRAFLIKGLYRDDIHGFRWRFDLEGLARDYSYITRAPVVEHTIEQPVLFIKGGNSDYLDTDDEPLIREVCAEPSLKVITGAGHWPHAEKPAQFTRICEQFIGVGSA